MPRWLSGRESTCQCRKGGRCRLIPGPERFPGRQNGNPLQWKIPQIKEPGRVQSIECQRVGEVWALKALPIQAHVASSLMFFSLFSGVITFQCDFPWPPYLKLKTLQPHHISYLSSLFFFFPPLALISNKYMCVDIYLANWNANPMKKNFFVFFFFIFFLLYQEQSLVCNDISSNICWLYPQISTLFMRYNYYPHIINKKVKS